MPNTRFYFLALAAVLACFTTGAQPFIAGQTYFSPEGYIEYRCGDLPVIISTPHGGGMAPASIPDRTCGTPTTVTDSWTTELGILTDSAFQRRTGCRPHLIICHLKRTKLDANRPLAEGACGDTTAARAWQAFHDWIDTARAIVARAHGKGFFT